MDSSAVPSEPIYTAHDIKRLLLVSLENEGVGSAKSVPSTMLTHLSMYDTSTTMPFPTALSFGEGEDLACIVEKAAKGFAAHDKLRQDLGYYIGNAENPLTEDMKRSVKELLDQDLVDRGLVVKNPKILKAPLLLKVSGHPFTFGSNCFIFLNMRSKCKPLADLYNIGPSYCK